MDLGLKNKNVILTGGSRGIGRAALEHFAKEGANVAFYSRNADQVKTAADELAAHGGKVFAESFEVTEDMDAYGAWLERLSKNLAAAIYLSTISARRVLALRVIGTRYSIRT